MIHFKLTGNHHKNHEVAVRRGLDSAFASLGDVGDKFVLIEFASRDEIKRLNQVWRDKDAPTDCLSLSSQETKAGTQLASVDAKGKLSFGLHKTGPLNPFPAIGQLVVCLEIIEANAALAGQPPDRELEWVIEHGVYHLLGFHHDND